MISITKHIEKLTVTRKPRGLTLIELVFVVAILAILAGFLVPRLGLLRNLAADGGNADQTRAALDQSVLYNIEQGKFPQGEDSLLDTTGALYSKLDAGLKGVLVSHTLTANEAKSINTQLTFDSTGATAAVFFDGSSAGSNTPNDDFVTSDPVTVGGASKVAQVIVPTALTSATYPIYAAVYGPDRLTATGTPSDGSFLVAIGDGTNTETNGKTALGAPVLFTKDPTSYSRPSFLIRIFGATAAASGFYSGSVSGIQYAWPKAGTAAATAGALDPRGSIVTQNLSQYQTDKQR